MKIRVSGKQMEIGEALPEQVRQKLTLSIGKYFDGGVDATIVFSHEGAFYRADCSAHLTPASPLARRVKARMPIAPSTSHSIVWRSRCAATCAASRITILKLQ